MSTQSSHISKRYYKSRIPKSSNTRGCNHVRLDPQYRCTKTNRPQNWHKCPGSQGQPTAATQLSRGDCRDSRARRSAHRCARCRVSTAPVTERLHTSLTEWQTGLPHDPPVRANRAACEKLSQLKEVSNTSVERTTLELQLCETAVYASLAPAQPPPPAGLASSLLVKVT